MQGPRFGMIRIIANSSTDSVARVSRARPRRNLRQSVFSSRWIGELTSRSREFARRQVHVS